MRTPKFLFMNSVQIPLPESNEDFAYATARHLLHELYHSLKSVAKWWEVITIEPRCIVRKTCEHTFRIEECWRFDVTFRGVTKTLEGSQSSMPTGHAWRLAYEFIAELDPYGWSAYTNKEARKL